MSSDRQPGRRRSERAMGHASATTGTLATPAARGRQKDLSQAARHAAAHRTLGRIQEVDAEPSSISSTSSTPRSGYRLANPLSLAPSDEEADVDDAAAAGRLSQQDRAETRRERTQALDERAASAANAEREQGNAQYAEREQSTENSGDEQGAQYAEQNPAHDPYFISDNERDQPARDRTLAGRHSPPERKEQNEEQEEQDHGWEEA